MFEVFVITGHTSSLLFGPGTPNTSPSHAVLEWDDWSWGLVGIAELLSPIPVCPQLYKILKSITIKTIWYWNKKADLKTNDIDLRAQANSQNVSQRS